MPTNSTLSNAPKIHPLADVLSSDVGDGTRIWQFSIILAGAKIGSDCNICAQTFIENDVVVGDGVTIKNGVQLWDGIRLGDNVFVGPNATFTNDKNPKSGNTEFECMETHVEEGASIGGGAVILPGIRIGKRAVVGAGAVVTRDVADGATVVGNPAAEIAK